MRINKFLALNAGLSRRKADVAVSNGRVTIDGVLARPGDGVEASNHITLDGKPIAHHSADYSTVTLNKPAGYVCSHDGQGNPTVYDLLPKKYRDLNIAGRLDKDSSGLVILTNNGQLLYELTHPSNDKEKVYEVTLDRDISPAEQKKLLSGVDIGDERKSSFHALQRIGNKKYKIVLKEGRNRQIRRSFEGINAKVLTLHRTSHGTYSIRDLANKTFIVQS